jgi:sigma-B regulation protein RsbU (phosphoserine phosphatase)
MPLDPLNATRSIRTRRTTFARRLVSWFGGASILVTAVAMTVAFVISRGFALHEVQDAIAQLLATATHSLENRLALVESTARMMSLDVEDGGLETASAARRYPALVVQNNPNIDGACLAFLPDTIPGHHGFAPYAWWKGDQVETIDLSAPPYDYLAQGWYRRALELGKLHWSKPHLMATSGQSVISCSFPFTVGGKPAGVAWADLSIQHLQHDMASQHVGTVGYGMIVSDDDLQPIVSSEQVAPKAVFLPELAEQMRNSDQGIVFAPDPVHAEPSIVSFQRLPGKGLILCLVHPWRQAVAGVRLLEMVLGLTGLVYIVALFWVVSLVARSVTRPLQALEEAARMASAGNLDAKMPLLKTNDELADIPRSFNNMMADLKAHVEGLRRATQEQERVSSELAIARGIQEGFLDRAHWPVLDELKVDADYLLATEVGGDFYDLFPIDDTRTAFVIGDSSGHGVAAALFMAVCRTLIRAYSLGCATPSECLESVNRHLQYENETMMFVTVIYGIIERPSGRVHLANAGHPPPLLKRADGSVTVLPSPHNRPLAIRAESRFEGQMLELSIGDRLVLFTDGVTEAEDAGQALFGTDRLVKAVEDVKGRGVKKIVRGIQDAVTAFVASAPIADDASMLVLAYSGAHLDLAPKIESVEAINEWLEPRLAHFPRRSVLQLQVALEETVVNIVRHGGGREDAPIRLAARVWDDGCEMVIENLGPPFDPTTAEASMPDVGEPAARTPGGWGLGLIRASVDRLEYSRRGDLNSLRLLLHLPSKGTDKDAV